MDDLFSLSFSSIPFCNPSSPFISHLKPAIILPALHPPSSPALSLLTSLAYSGPPINTRASTVGNLAGGLLGTVGDVVGATGRGLGDTVNATTGTKAVGDGLKYATDGIEDGTNRVGKGVEDVGKGKV